MFAGKPIIGLSGGIGSGKSFIARLFGELGCHVTDSDAQVRAAYQDPGVRKTLAAWWGPGVIVADGQINRGLIAGKVFSHPAEKLKLEALLHPLVDELRRKEMSAVAQNPSVVAFVWDTPLLFEAGLEKACDALVFVDSPYELRLARVRETRGWGPEELARREILQLPLDRKRKISDYVVSNTADAAHARDQVRELLPRILAGSTHRPVATIGPKDPG